MVEAGAFHRLKEQREANLGNFLLTPLTPAQTHEDFAVVVEHSDILEGLFGDSWPADLTLEANTRDLERHEREFEDGTGFAWIVRDLNCKYAGCAYVVPNATKKSSARVVTWLSDRGEEFQLLSRFNREFRTWLLQHLPTDISLDWTTNEMS